jgi:hypothetical protein
MLPSTIRRKEKQTQNGGKWCVKLCHKTLKVYNSCQSKQMEIWCKSVATATTVYFENKAQKWPCQLTQNANLLPYLELKEVGFSFSFLFFSFLALFHCLKHWVVGRRIGWVTMWQKLWTYSAQHKLRIYLEILEQKWCCTVHHTSVDSFFFFVLLLLLLLLWWLKTKNFWPEGAIGVCGLKFVLCHKRVCYWVKNKKAFLWSWVYIYGHSDLQSSICTYLLTYLLTYIHTYHFVKKMCFFNSILMWSCVYAFSLSLLLPHFGTFNSTTVFCNIKPEWTLLAEWKV